MCRLTVEPGASYTVGVGANLSLPCGVEDRRGLVQWTRSGGEGGVRKWRRGEEGVTSSSVGECVPRDDFGLGERGGLQASFPR